jgi:Tol biopolymer transport system component
VAGGAALAAGLLAGFGLRGQGDTGSGPEQAHYQLRPITAYVGAEYDSGWSPDGNFLAYSHTANGPLDIFVLPREGGEPIPLVVSPADDGAPRWSPDARWIVFASNRDDRTALYLVPPLGGPVRRLAEIGFAPLDLLGLEAALGAQPWSPDSSRIVFSRRVETGDVGLFEIDVETGEERALSSPPSGTLDLAASWSFDGKRIVHIHSLPRGSMELRLIDLAADSVRSLPVRATTLQYPTWAPDDRSLLVGSDQGGSLDIWRFTLAGGTLKPITLGPQDVSISNVSPSGRVAVSSFSHQTDLYIQALDGGPARRLTAHTHGNFESQWSPDGRLIAYASTRTGGEELWILEVQTGQERRLTDNSDLDLSPTWSPDGSELAFISSRDGGPALWVVDVDGRRPRRLSKPDAERSLDMLSRPSWSPDGAVIGFIQQGGGLYTIDRKGKLQGPLLEGVQAFGWYRDARRVIYTTGGTGDGRPAEMRVSNLRTGEEQVLLQQPHVELAVSRDGSMVSYVRSTSHFDMQLNLIRLEPPDQPDGLPRTRGEPEVIAHGQGEWHVHNGGFSPDGSRVVYTRDTDTGDLFELTGLF